MIIVSCDPGKVNAGTYAVRAQPSQAAASAENDVTGEDTTAVSRFGPVRSRALQTAIKAHQLEDAALQQSHSIITSDDPASRHIVKWASLHSASRQRLKLDLRQRQKTIAWRTSSNLLSLMGIHASHGPTPTPINFVRAAETEYSHLSTAERERVLVVLGAAYKNKNSRINKQLLAALETAGVDFVAVTVDEFLSSRVCPDQSCTTPDGHRSL